MVFPKTVGIIVFKKLLEFIGRAGLDIKGLLAQAVPVVLPDDYVKQTSFPRLIDLTDGATLPAHTRQFKTRMFPVRNYGRAQHADDCEIVAYVTTTAGILPIECYWENAGEREFVNIPPRETRLFIPFLVDVEEKRILFSTAYYPEYTGSPSWQFSIPIRSPFSLDIEIRSSSAGSCREVFFFGSKGPSLNALYIMSTEHINTRKKK